MSQSTAFSHELWQRHLWRWLAPLLAVAAMAGLLSVYKAVYAGRVAQLEKQFEEETSRLEDLAVQREEVIAMVEQAEESREGIRILYADRFATESERLTSVIREVKDLAERAGLSPDTISYPEEEIAGQGLVRKQIGFSVQGNYSSLRRFINFLEISESFLTLEGITVSDAEGELLNLNLRLSTLFARPEDDGSPAAGSSAGGGA